MQCPLANKIEAKNPEYLAVLQLHSNGGEEKGYQLGS